MKIYTKYIYIYIIYIYECVCGCVCVCVSLSVRACVQLSILFRFDRNMVVVFRRPTYIFI